MISVNDLVGMLKNEDIANGQRVSMEPLTGAFNGINRIFRTLNSPIDDESVVLHDAYLQAIAEAGYSINDDETGLIVFVVAPTDEVYATYSVVDFSSSRLSNYVEAGIAEMERRVPRGYVLVEDGSDRVLSSTPSSSVDPVMYNGTTFSEDGRQVGYLLLACKYVIAMSMMRAAASKTMMYREERSGGLMVDTTKAPSYWNMLADQLDKQLDTMRFDITGDYGAVIPGEHKEEDAYPGALDWFLGYKRDKGDSST